MLTFRLLFENFKLFLSSINPDIKGAVTQYEIQNHLEKLGIPKKFIMIRDLQYKTISVEDWERFLKFSIAHWKAYRKESYDCEDFTDVLIGQAKLLLPGVFIGEIHVDRGFEKDRHALAFTLVKLDAKSSELFFIEPQINSVFNLNFALKMKRYKPVWARC